MDFFEVNQFGNNTPSYLGAIRAEIDMDPVYQRQGEVWPLPKKQLLIDSLINEFDLPKIYLHKYQEPIVKNGQRIRYALVDGKQRLEAIFGFLDNRFALADDFKLFRDEDVNLGGLTFKEISEKYPEVISLFTSTSLPIYVINTGDIEFIEEMFSRLNNGTALNAPELRNSFGGPAPTAVIKIATHSFFTKKLPFSDNRYRHRDLAAKFLLWEDDWASGDESRVKDVKKKYLDGLFKELKRGGVKGKARADVAEKSALARLDELAKTFIDADPLLQSVGLVSVYYILLQDRQASGKTFPTREQLLTFEKHRKQDLAVDEDKLTRGHVALLDFNRLAQSPNDNQALVRRFRVLDAYTRALSEKKDPMLAIAKLAPEQEAK